MSKQLIHRTKKKGKHRKLPEIKVTERKLGLVDCSTNEELEVEGWT